jgi:hypothetical protein
MGAFYVLMHVSPYYYYHFFAYEFIIGRYWISEYRNLHASILYSIFWAPLRVSFDREGRATIRLFFGDRWVTLNGMEWNGIIIIIIIQ